MRKLRNKNTRRVLKKRKQSKGTSSSNTTGSGVDSTQRKKFATSLKKKSSSSIHKGIRDAVSLSKKKTLTVKKQAQERMVLKEHLIELKRKRMTRTRGTDAKNERRQMGKYIKQLKQQQVSKHAGEITDINNEASSTNKNHAFTPAFVSRKKQNRYLNPPVTVGLPHGKSENISAGAVPLPSNVSGNVGLLVRSSASGSSSSSSFSMSEQQNYNHQQKRWTTNNSNNNNQDSEWIDDDGENDESYTGGGGGQFQQQNSKSGKSNNNNNNTSQQEQLRQLFAGFK